MKIFDAIKTIGITMRIRRAREKKQFNTLEGNYSQLQIFFCVNCINSALYYYYTYAQFLIPPEEKKTIYEWRRSYRFSTSHGDVSGRTL